MGSVGAAAHHALAASDPSGMLTGLPHLTPAPFNAHAAHAHAHAHAYPSLDDMKYHNAAAAHSHHVPHPQTDYASSLHSHMGVTSAASAAAASTSSFPYPPSLSSSAASSATGLSASPITEHSHPMHNSVVHHHAKLNLQTS